MKKIWVSFHCSMISCVALINGVAGNNLFHATGLFQYPWKHQKPQSGQTHSNNSSAIAGERVWGVWPFCGFFILSESTERDRWHEMELNAFYWLRVLRGTLFSFLDLFSHHYEKIDKIWVIGRYLACKQYWKHCNLSMERRFEVLFEMLLK